MGEFLFHSLLLAAEFGQLGSGEPFGGQGDTGRVDRHAVEAHFVVQVRAGAAAGGADEADDVAGAHALAGGGIGGKRAHVAVERLHAVAVAQDDGIAVAAFGAAEFHDAVGWGVNRRTGGGGVVDAGVHAQIAQYRVDAHAEGRADAATRHGLGFKTFLQRLAVFVVVAAVAVFAEIVGAVELALVADFHGENVAHGNLLAVKVVYLIKDAYGVAGFELIEIEPVAEQFAQGIAYFGRDFGARHGAGGGAAGADDNGFERGQGGGFHVVGFGLPAVAGIG